MTKKVKIKDIYVGGLERVKIQSMTTFKPQDTLNTIKQILELEKVGCDIVRFCIVDENDALAIKEIKAHTNIPLVADIHFDYRLALKSIENGIDKVRINPGNIGSDEKIKIVAAALKEKDIPIRVGANSGSLEKEYLNKYGLTANALVESALNNVNILEKNGIENIVISVKSSSVKLAVEAYQLLSKKCNYPLHLGITEAGTYDMGIVKSSIGIGSLLLNGIGDTIRVSLSDNPVKEVIAAKRILRSVGLDNNFVEVISCPTCGRCSWDSIGLAKKIENMTENYSKRIKVAVMGCIVNGPGEAKECDIGIAGGESGCVIFKKGKIYKTIKKEQAEDYFLKEIEKLINE